ncbi:MAG: UDP-N-acetylmuramoyl-L-alanine--D-glutamate ligase [Treponema sp.]|jgi:UDP-N-acetylmuramoylalanine--D-glutamate ligase|nr:UDP-N-acetylmuramoyl-L-alanine--D-glutamate ligase [Treponema sp.]
MNNTKTEKKRSFPKQNFQGVKALIMGLGLNGGGLESALYLGLRGAQLCVTDLQDEKKLAPSIEKLEAGLSGKACGIRYVLGRHEISDFENADLVIKNPGVKPDSQYLKVCRCIETDISLFLTASPAQLTAVTGTKGKSSTASCLHWVLKNWHDRSANSNRAYLGGNITVSPLSFADVLEAGDDVVLELSSWQLGDLKGRINKEKNEALLKPRAAVITSIMPDHLDRYGTMDAYIADKRIIYQGQDKNDSTIAENDSWGQSFFGESRGRPLAYSAAPMMQDICGGWIDESVNCGFVRLWEGCCDYKKNNEVFEIVPCELKVPGVHQKKNCLAAALALLDLGLPLDFIRESVRNYPGIEHRLEFFHESGGIRFYNDSAATIPEAAAAAIRAFENKPILICGGTDKNLDFSPLAEAASGAKALILLEGSGSSKLARMLKESNIAYDGPFDSLDAACLAALEKAAPKDNLILSPGCASFGVLFDNEFDRGNKWKEAVRRIAP